MTHPPIVLDKEEHLDFLLLGLTDPTTGKKMTQMYCGLLKKYHGADAGVMQIDPQYCQEWSFIYTSTVRSMCTCMPHQLLGPPPLANACPSVADCVLSEPVTRVRSRVTARPVSGPLLVLEVMGNAGEGS